MYEETKIVYNSSYYLAFIPNSRLFEVSYLETAISSNYRYL